MPANTIPVHEIFQSSRLMSVTANNSGTPANTNETNLVSVFLPSKTLTDESPVLRIEAMGFFAANANVKTLRLRFGSVVVPINPISVAPNADGWRLKAFIVRKDIASQRVALTSAIAGVPQQTIFVTSIDGTEDMINPIRLSITGQNGTASANDIVCAFSIVELLAPPILGIAV